MQSRPIRIGVLGVGHLGKIHLRCIKALGEQLALVGFYDPNDSNSVAAQSLFPGLRRFDSFSELLNAVDAVDIVSTTSTHYTLALQALQAGKHIFVEKPLTTTLSESEEICKLATSQKLIGQVGHVERFNPALISAKDAVEIRPMFIEGHRLAPFTERGTDVSVVLDLMIHDIDIVLSLVKSPIKSISAAGARVLCNTPDIANARIEFENGCVANLTASRVSVKQMRKLRIFQQDTYISMDFAERRSEIIRLYDSPELAPAMADLMEVEADNGRTRYMHLFSPEPPHSNAIQEELKSFAECVQQGMQPQVSLIEGHTAIVVATRIAEEIDGRMAIDN